LDYAINKARSRMSRAVVVGLQQCWCYWRRSESANRRQIVAPNHRGGAHVMQHISTPLQNLVQVTSANQLRFFAGSLDAGCPDSSADNEQKSIQNEAAKKYSRSRGHQSGSYSEKI